MPISLGSRLGVAETRTAPPRRPPCPHDPYCQTNTDISLSFLNKAQCLSLGPALVLCRIVTLHPKWFLRKGNRTHRFTFASSLVSSARSC